MPILAITFTPQNEWLIIGGVVVAMLILVLIVRHIVAIILGLLLIAVVIAYVHGHHIAVPAQLSHITIPHIHISSPPTTS